MDNSTTTWIMVALLLLLIAAAIYMLLRRPGGDGSTAVNNRDVTGVDAPGGAGNTGTDVLAEGRDLGPGTAAPEVDSLRGRADEPFDQHAETDQRRYDDSAADQAAVTDDAQVPDEDQGVWRQAAAVGAAGAAGAGVVAATGEEEPTTADDLAPQETEYVLREDDHEPVPVFDVEPVEDTYGAPAQEDTYAAPVDESTYASPVEEDTAYTPPAQEDTTYTAPVADELAEEPVLDEPAQDPTWDDTFAHEPADSAQVRTDEVGAAPADVHPLSAEEIDAGAREEPLPADEQAPLAPEDISGADAGAHGDEVVQDDHSDADRQGWRDAAAIGAVGAAGVAAPAAVSQDEPRAHTPSAESQVSEPASDEYPVGEPTTYGTDGADPVAADEQAPVDGRGYHDDTTLVGEEASLNTATGVEPTTDFEAGTAVGGATFADGRLDSPATSYQQGEFLEQPETDGGIEELGAGSAYAEPGVDTPVEDTTGSADVAGDAAADAAGGTALAESVYGPGSAEPGEDGTGPTGWEIKGNSGSMLFHTPESPSYDAVRAEVWFDSEESARAAGFAHWDRRRR